MTGFLIFGIILTVALLAGGGYALWRVERSLRGGGGGIKRRHREEARQLQVALDADGDFTRNFHRPTQNEILETLQALDHLTPGWETDSKVLTDGRFKNELAESFPALRRSPCAYPHAIASDVARRFGKTKLSAEALEESLRAHASQRARQRAAFHTTRAQANAQHQMSTGPAVGPVMLAAGSLPFRVSEEKRGRQLAWLIPGSIAASLAVVTAGAYWYATSHPGLGKTWQEAAQPKAESHQAIATSPPAKPTPADTAPVPNPEVAAATAASTPVNFPGETPLVAVQPVAQVTPAPVAPPKLVATPVVSLAQRVAESQFRAVDKYPALAVPDSEINLRFVFRYKRLVEDKSPRLQQPDWPEKLADECAASIGPAGKGKKLSQASPAHR